MLNHQPNDPCNLSAELKAQSDSVNYVITMCLLFPRTGQLQKEVASLKAYLKVAKKKLKVSGTGR